MQSDSLTFCALGPLYDGGGLHVHILFTHYHVANALTQDSTALMQRINTVLSYIPQKKTENEAT